MVNVVDQMNKTLEEDAAIMIMWLVVNAVMGQMKRLLTDTAAQKSKLLAQTQKNAALIHKNTNSSQSCSLLDQRIRFAVKKTNIM